MPTYCDDLTQFDKAKIILRPTKKVQKDKNDLNARPSVKKASSIMKSKHDVRNPWLERKAPDFVFIDADHFMQSQGLARKRLAVDLVKCHDGTFRHPGQEQC